jgi:hypothetical protein
MADWSVEDLDSDLHLLWGIDSNRFHKKRLSRTTDNGSLITITTDDINESMKQIRIMRSHTRLQYLPLQVMTFPDVSFGLNNFLFVTLSCKPCVDPSNLTKVWGDFELYLGRVCVNTLLACSSIAMFWWILKCSKLAITWMCLRAYIIIILLFFA